MIFVVGGGGGGSLKDTDAILTVTVPTGSTVTMTKGGVTLTPTIWVQAADPTLDCALFVISPSMFDSQNAWTVTATLDTNTASDSVTISANEQYDLILSYHVHSGYQEVEYLAIGNSAGPYIDPMVNCGSQSYYEIKCQWPTAKNAETDIFGTWVSNKDTQLAYWKGAMVFQVGGVSYNSAYDSNAHIYKATSNEMLFDGVNVKTPNWNNTPSYPYLIFARTTANNHTAVNKDYNCRVYYCKLWNGNSLIRDMYPCYRKSDSVAGMYDAVNDVFYTNAGSGTFVVGPDV